MEIHIHRRLLTDLLGILSRESHCLLLRCQFPNEIVLLLLEKGLSSHLFELADANTHFIFLLISTISTIAVVGEGGDVLFRDSRG